jgi:homogentisate 1,2-dioxygenase
MFESRYRFIPTEFALTSPQLDARYADCWAGLKDRFEP